jgi:hypothetical protein
MTWALLTAALAGLVARPLHVAAGALAGSVLQLGARYFL